MARLGILVGGGPAPGINGVISAATIEAQNNGIEVVGFLEGFRHLIAGTTDQVRKLETRSVSRIHFRGGSILMTSRANPTTERKYMENTLKVLRHHDVKYMLTIGGDDTAHSASKLAEAAVGEIAVAHVPKTIDNDLPLPPTIPTFGFQTAMHVGVGIVQNLMADAETAPRWYVVVAMGRTAGHLALGIGKAAGVPLVLIPEEWGDREITIDHICDIAEGSIIKRRESGRDHGVCILAEGLIEHMTEKHLRDVFGEERIVRDPHGHLRLDDLEIGTVVREELRKRFKARKDSITIVSKNLGYELRSADPIPYDCEYVRNLGYGAVKFLLAGQGGAVITFQGGVMKPLTFESLRDPATGRPRVRYVEVSGESYQVGRNYMIRLDDRDFREAERVEKLAAAGKMSVEEFRKRFEYLAREPIPALAPH